MTDMIITIRIDDACKNIPLEEVIWNIQNGLDEMFDGEGIQIHMEMEAREKHEKWRTVAIKDWTGGVE